ncbi:unnamed protein product, partial [Prorocentrum cordatum]
MCRPRTARVSSAARRSLGNFDKGAALLAKQLLAKGPNPPRGNVRPSPTQEDNVSFVPDVCETGTPCEQRRALGDKNARRSPRAPLPGLAAQRPRATPLQNARVGHRAVWRAGPAPPRGPPRALSLS